MSNRSENIKRKQRPEKKMNVRSNSSDRKEREKKNRGLADQAAAFAATEPAQRGIYKGARAEQGEKTENRNKRKNAGKMADREAKSTKAKVTVKTKIERKTKAERKAETETKTKAERKTKTKIKAATGDVQEQRLACENSGRCGGCVYIHETYREQLMEKERTVRKLLKDVCRTEPIIGMEYPFHYRNKVNASFSRRRDGTIISGIYEEGTHRVIPVENCKIEDEKADQIIGSVRELLKSFKITIYNENSGYGLLRHAMVRRGFATGEIMLVLVVTSPVFPSKNNFVRALRKKHPEITTVVLNINDRDTSMVLGDRNITLFGRGYIEDVLCGCTFRLSPSSFYQVNPVQTERLYTLAVEMAGLTGKERVIDAYCGIGTISLIAARRAKEVIGVELNKDAVRDAVQNAKRNEIGNARFFQGDAGAFMTGMAAQGERADVVFMDPPRAGSDEAFLSSLEKLGPRRIVYISCNPETLARDLKWLKRRGYEAKRAVPVDMFGWTGHVETVALLTRKAR